MTRQTFNSVQTYCLYARLRWRFMTLEALSFKVRWLETIQTQTATGVQLPIDQQTQLTGKLKSMKLAVIFRKVPWKERSANVKNNSFERS